VRNPWLDRRPLHYAHQGGAREAPSSTKHAMRRAVHDHGADAIELDVHRTVDGHLVVCHDTTVDRTTAATGPIHELTLAELRRLDPAYWWSPGFDARDDLHDDAYPLRGAYPGEPSLGIATLDEVLDEFASVFLNFDIKETGPVRYEAQLADRLRAYGRVDDVIVASFHDDALRVFSAHAPDIHVSLGPTDTFAFYGAIHDGAPMPTWAPSQVALQVPATFEDVEVVTADFVKGAHDVGLAVHVWTIDESEEMHRLLDLGVDGVMTDCPSALAGVLRSRTPG
jgi:glycerophosphoryl diester phosphodiesterase